MQALEGDFSTLPHLVNTEGRIMIEKRIKNAQGNYSALSGKHKNIEMFGQTNKIR